MRVLVVEDESGMAAVLRRGLTEEGFAVVSGLRAARCWAPVLLLTARDSVADRVRGLDAGADDYLTKPFAFAELVARLRALIRRGAVERPPVTVGDITLDPARRTVWRGADEVVLTAKEYAVLECFMRRPGRVLSRTDLIEHVWDVTFDVDSNIVEVYVGQLRKKVGRHSLETVRGMGYRLRETCGDDGAE